MTSVACGSLLAILTAGLPAHVLSLEQSHRETDEPAISVFVASSDAMNGILRPSKDQQETVKDLQKEIGKRASMRLVSASDNPLVAVIVTGRYTAQRASATRGRAPATRRVIAVKLLYLGADVGMTAVSGDEADVGENPWDKVIAKLAQQLDGWIAANRELLLTK
jgi:hypothetical protein